MRGTTACPMTFSPSILSKLGPGSGASLRRVRLERDKVKFPNKGKRKGTTETHASASFICAPEAIEVGVRTTGDSRGGCINTCDITGGRRASDGGVSFVLFGDPNDSFGLTVKAQPGANPSSRRRRA